MDIQMKHNSFYICEKINLNLKFKFKSSYLKIFICIFNLIIRKNFQMNLLNSFNKRIY